MVSEKLLHTYLGIIFSKFTIEENMKFIKPMVKDKNKIISLFKQIQKENWMRSSR